MKSLVVLIVAFFLNTFTYAPFLQAEVKVYDGLIEPFSIVFDQDQSAYGVEYEQGNRVFLIKSGRIEFISGINEAGGKNQGDIAAGDGMAMRHGRFNGMHDLTLSRDGKLFIADTFNNRIRLINLNTETITTFAGIGGKGGFQKGTASEAAFNNPYTVDLSPDGKRLLVADLGNRRVREIDLNSQQVTTVAGNGKRGIPQDGSISVNAPLVAPRAAIYGRDGSIFIASREGHALRHVDLDGKIRTVVNASGKKGYQGDEGPGVNARLKGPKHLCLDPQGHVVISDDQNHCIRLYNIETGTIHLLAGTPGTSGTGIGSGPLDTQLNRPHGARYDSQGRLWVCDSMNHRILCFD